MTSQSGHCTQSGPPYGMHSSPPLTWQPYPKIKNRRGPRRECTVHCAFSERPFFLSFRYFLQVADGTFLGKNICYWVLQHRKQVSCDVRRSLFDVRCSKFPIPSQPSPRAHFVPRGRPIIIATDKYPLAPFPYPTRDQNP
jgi:hypothetical protein